MKALLPFLALSACTCFPQAAVAAHPQQTSPTPRDSAPRDATQPPAPIVRPRPINLPPKPLASGQQPTGSSALTATTGRIGVSSSTGQTAPIRPRPRSLAPASGVPSSPATPARQLPPGTATVPFNRTTIVLDASHGGVDGGSRITDTLQEKDVDLAFAFRLRSLLTARGFTVQLTRENDAATPSDTATPLKLDDRAGFANHLHPVACLLLHSTGSGKGVHLYSSELAPSPLQPALVPWLTAQASWVNASRALGKQLGIAIGRAEVPLVMSRASIRPLDSLTCPALVVELAPSTSDKESVNDANYQQRVATAIASAMIFWQNQAQPPDRQVPIPVAPPAAPANPAAAPSTTGAQP